MLGLLGVASETPKFRLLWELQKVWLVCRRPGLSFNPFSYCVASSMPSYL